MTGDGAGVPLDPPERLARTLPHREGEAGRAWLAALPGLLHGYLARWRLTPVRVVRPGGSISMIVLVATADGTPAVLKLGLAADRTRQEAAALTAWDGRAAVRLLRTAPEDGVLLLERLHGGVSLRSLPEPKAMLEAAEVLRRLWVDPAPERPFRTVAERSGRVAQALRGQLAEPWAAPIGPLVEAALAERDRLTAPAGEQPPQVLLHGDFHHGNVLAGDRAPWLAIDPEPLVGEAAYDVAWLALDRLETLAAQPSAPARAARRIGRLADSLALDADRVRGWTLFRAVAAGARSLARGERAGGELLLEFASWL